MRTREARLLGAVALGACLLLACCSGGAATRVPPAGPPPAAPVQVLSTPALAAAPPVRIRISAIGVDSALIALGLAADGTLQVPVDGSVAGWFTGAPTPGEHGPAVIAAHVDWNHAPGVFFHLRDLEPGAEVAVDRADGTTARFVVLEVEQYPKDAFPTERVYGDIDHAGLRLITCGGSFDRAARSYRDNVVVYAGLVGSGLIDDAGDMRPEYGSMSPVRRSRPRDSRIGPAVTPSPILSGMSLDHLLRRQGGVVTLRQAVELGIAKQTVHRRAREGTWKRLRPGVYLVGGHRLTDEVRGAGGLAVGGRRRRGVGPGGGLLARHARAGAGGASS